MPREKHCDSCNRTFECPSKRETHEKFRDHLLERHEEELRNLFRLNYDGKDCMSCSRPIHMSEKTETDLACPYCSHDHSKWYAGSVVVGWNYFLREFDL
ncbi:hypothetical protein [Halorubrum ezzemoulense]|uniref:hypothetical protein n=1 Tax=Halorubrum ezzemoulense TaxID=337243 RepID=UPI0011311650|nr:hypothetical protein [Halorubrum ezzemoulense]